MLKLPQNAMVFLAGVRGAHDPPDPEEARERVLGRLEAALVRGSCHDVEGFRRVELTVPTILEPDD